MSLPTYWYCCCLLTDGHFIPKIFCDFSMKSIFEYNLLINYIIAIV